MYDELTHWMLSSPAVHRQEGETAYIGRGNLGDRSDTKVLSFRQRLRAMARRETASGYQELTNNCPRCNAEGS